jgi:hypothetical protein
MLFPMSMPAKRTEATTVVGMIIYGNYFDMPDNIHTILSTGSSHANVTFHDSVRYRKRF